MIFSDFITVPLAAGAYLTQEETVQPANTKLTTFLELFSVWSTAVPVQLCDTVLLGAITSFQ